MCVYVCECSSQVQAACCVWTGWFVWNSWRSLCARNDHITQSAGFFCSFAMLVRNCVLRVCRRYVVTVCVLTFPHGTNDNAICTPDLTIGRTSGLCVAHTTIRIQYGKHNPTYNLCLLMELRYKYYIVIICPCPNTYNTSQQCRWVGSRYPKRARRTRLSATASLKYIVHC